MAWQEREVRAGVADIILEIAEREDVQDSTDLRLIEDLAFHSLSLIELSFTLEDEYDLEPMDDEEELSVLNTVGDVVDYVVSQLRSRDLIADEAVPKTGSSR